MAYNLEGLIFLVNMFEGFLALEGKRFPPIRRYFTVCCVYKSGEHDYSTETMLKEGKSILQIGF
jgi:hypothetical protein